MAIFEFVKGKLSLRRGPVDSNAAMLGCLLASSRNSYMEDSTREQLKVAVSRSEVSLPEFGNNLVKAMFGAARPSIFFQEARNLGLLRQVAPDLVACIGFSHGCSVSDDVFDHLLTTLDCTPSVSVGVRLAALLHDLAKPWAWSLREGEMVFEAVEDRSSDMSREWLSSLKVPEQLIDEACHMIGVQNLDELILNPDVDWGSMSPDAREDLFAFWVGHIVGSGRPKGGMGELGLFVFGLKRSSKG